MLAKAMRIFFFQSVKLIAMQIFRKKTFLSYPSSKNWKKNLHLDTQNAVVTTLPKISRKTSKNFCSKSGNEEKKISCPKNLFVKFFLWACTTKFWQAWRNLVAKNTKNFPELQKCWIYNLLNKLIFFLIKNDSFGNGESNFDNGSK